MKEHKVIDVTDSINEEDVNDKLHWKKHYVIVGILLVVAGAGLIFQHMVIFAAGATGLFIVSIWRKNNKKQLNKANANKIRS